MADFQAAYDILKPNEGGYRNASYDLGGETYRGISRKYWPSWSGWAWIDSYKAAHGALSTGTVFPDLESAVMDFYRTNFWNKVQGSQILNQQLANAVFDFCVQSGYGPEKINQALGTGSSNAITSATLAALNADPSGAFNKIQAARISYYETLNAQGSISDNDIQGILARVKRLASPGALLAAGSGLAIIGALVFFCS